MCAGKLVIRNIIGGVTNPDRIIFPIGDDRMGGGGMFNINELHLGIRLKYNIIESKILIFQHILLPWYRADNVQNVRNDLAFCRSS